MIRTRKQQLWYKLGKEKEKYPIMVYYILELCLLCWEVLKGILRFLNGIIITTFIFVIISLYVLYNLIKPTADECINFVNETVYTTNVDTFKYHDESIYNNYIEYEQIPEMIINTLVLTEDVNYWEHHGIDIKGMISNIISVLKDEVSTTVYTIPQQLTRDIFLDNKIGVKNKAKELLLTRKLDKKFTKEDILEFYCNCKTSGTGIYGIENASKFYLGKSVNDLSLKEQIYICVIISDYNNYNPWKSKKKVENRSEEVLGILFENNYITEKEYNNALKENVVIL